MRRLYASKLTKKDLEAEGITEITKDCKIFKGEKEIFPFWIPGKRPYLGLCIYERDENGHLIKSGKDRICKYKKADGSIGECNSWIPKYRILGLHRIMWAWHYGEVPEGMVVDHIDNKHETLYDYRLENLQLLTPQENLNKDRDSISTKIVKCKMNKPKEFYENKLLKYEKEYEEAKKNHDADAAHKLRGNIANTRARLRYWDQHKEEYEDHITFKEAEEGLNERWRQNVKDRKLLEQYKQMFRESGNKTMWRQMVKVIKAWDTLDSIQKEHVFEVLHRFFSK